MAIKSNKELKEEFKLIKQPAGVYQIRNLKNGKIYIGSSLNLNAAWNSNRFQLEMGSHRNKALQEDWNSSGAKKFAFEILEKIILDDDPTADLRAEVKTLESMLMEELQPFDDRGYHSHKS